MKKRIYIALIMLAVVVGAFAFRLIPNYGVYVFDLLIGVLAILCTLEITKILDGMNIKNSPMAIGIYPSVMFAGHVFYYLFNLKFYYWIIIQIGALALTILITYLTFLSLDNRYMKNLMKETRLSKSKLARQITLGTLIACAYPCFLFLAYMLMNRIDQTPLAFVESFQGNLGWMLLTLAVAIPVVTDTCAMLCGSLFGGKKLCPKISPKKTISGACSAVLISSIVSGGLYYLFKVFNCFEHGFILNNITMWQFVLFGFLCSIVSQLGDLFESFLKRKANVKDSGTIFAGHGGFLDRLDSHLFAAPFTYIYFVVLLLI